MMDTVKGDAQKNVSESFIGEYVIHPVLGRGVIIPPRAKYSGEGLLNIEFPNKDIKVYRYPDAFDNGSLSPDSGKIQAAIDLHHAPHICVNCLQYDKRVDRDKGITLCPSCVELFTKCAGCKKTIKKAKNLLYQGKYFCKQCVQESFCNCERCNNLFPKEHNVKAKISDYSIICPKCADRIYRICDLCGEFVEKKYFQRFELGSICQECMEQKTALCRICGERYIIRVNDCGLCQTCQRQAEYCDAIAAYDFSSAKTEKMRFDTFKTYNQCQSLMTRLRMDKDDVRSVNGVHIERKCFDVLVLENWDYSLVILWNVPNKKAVTYSGQLTLTSLKKLGISYVISKCQSVETFAVPFLQHELRVWKQPFRLNAKTDFDTFYGDRYYWKGGVLEDIDYGNKYGDTSEFMIIGYYKYDK